MVFECSTCKVWAFCRFRYNVEMCLSWRTRMKLYFLRLICPQWVLPTLRPWQSLWENLFECYIHYYAAVVLNIQLNATCKVTSWCQQLGKRWGNYLYISIQKCPVYVDKFRASPSVSHRIGVKWRLNFFPMVRVGVWKISSQHHCFTVLFKFHYRCGWMPARGG